MVAGREFNLARKPLSHFVFPPSQVVEDEGKRSHHLSLLSSASRKRGIKSTRRSAQRAFFIIQTSLPSSVETICSQRAEILLPPTQRKAAEFEPEIPHYSAKAVRVKGKTHHQHRMSSVDGCFPHFIRCSNEKFKNFSLPSYNSPSDSQPKPPSLVVVFISFQKAKDEQKEESTSNRFQNKTKLSNENFSFLISILALVAFQSVLEDETETGFHATLFVCFSCCCLPTEQKEKKKKSSKAHRFWIWVKADKSFHLSLRIHMTRLWRIFFSFSKPPRSDSYCFQFRFMQNTTL